MDGPAAVLTGVTNKVVAFLLAERESLISQQQSSQLNFIPIKATMVDWSRFALCVFS